MFGKINISFAAARSLPPLVHDYLQRSEILQEFYTYFPDRNGFTNLLAEDPYKDFDRSILHGALLKQANSVANTSQESLHNIGLLQNKNTYTITTGHQLCLFTGPLYFIYKIFSVIHLCDTLNSWFPAHRFVPVYWMAGEDHDFEEINHFKLFGKTLTWRRQHTGAVGALDTDGLHEIHHQLRDILGSSKFAGELLQLFESSYLRHSGLKDATRFLVNELYGKYGLVTADGNDPELKMQGKDIFIRDVFEQQAFRKVGESVAALEKHGYKPQVNPREVNCFYLDDGIRARIEQKEGQYHVAGSEIRFNAAAMRRLIETEPWKISPNVVLRPLYQQRILPNLAYVGGPGELSYWLEYRNLFEASGIPFPVLCPRSFFTVIDRSLSLKLSRAGLEPTDVFRPEEELIRAVLEKSDKLLDLSAEKSSLAALYETLKQKVSRVDASLAAAVMAELQKALNGIENLEKKGNRAFKSRSETELNLIRQILQRTLPDGVPQERSENFAGIYSQTGSAFLEAIRAYADPLELKHKLLVETGVMSGKISE